MTAVETLVFSIPSKINLSPREKVPLVLYTVKEVLSVTSDLRYPTAPLDFPLTCVGVERVIGSFNVIVVYV